MPATAQMNIRIDESLKARGDEALAHAGLSASQAVRAVWRFAADHAQDPRRIARALSFDSDELDSRAEDRAKRVEEIEAGQRIWEDGLVRLGLSAHTDVYSGMPVEDLRELALLDRLAERGQA